MAEEAKKTEKKEEVVKTTPVEEVNQPTPQDWFEPKIYKGTSV